MEVLVALVGALTAFLLLAVLGAMREVTLLWGQTEALAQPIKSPPPTTSVQAGQVPDALKQQLSRFLPQIALFARGALGELGGARWIS
jgi:hypothetical protein